jgi:hypothetical protein
MGRVTQRHVLLARALGFTVAVTAVAALVAFIFPEVGQVAMALSFCLAVGLGPIFARGGGRSRPIAGR